MRKRRPDCRVAGSRLGYSSERGRSSRRTLGTLGKEKQEAQQGERE